MSNVRKPKPRTNPYEIGIAYNETMRAWDIQVLVGGFASEKEALDVAEKLARFMGGGQKVTRQ